MIQSVERAMRIMELLDESGAGKPLRVLELSRLIGLKQPTVHNFLQTLVQLGYVAQEEETSKYYLTENTRFLGWSGTKKQQLIQSSRPVAQRLFDRFNETVLLVVQDKNIRTTLFSINSSRALTVRAESRMDSKFYSSATGRCLLCGLNPDGLEQIYRINELPLAGEWDSVRTREDINRELQQIQKAGHSIYKAEGVVAIGAPVFLPKPSINAALGLFIPESRFTPEIKKEIIPAVMDTAAEIVRVCNT